MEEFEKVERLSYMSHFFTVKVYLLDPVMFYLLKHNCEYTFYEVSVCKQRIDVTRCV